MATYTKWFDLLMIYLVAAYICAYTLSPVTCLLILAFLFLFENVFLAVFLSYILWVLVCIGFHLWARHRNIIE